MSDFDETRWADPAFSREYIEQADHYIPDRFHLFNVLRSYFRAFVARPGGHPVRVCDLGCGDGILTDHLLREGPAIGVTLIDGSGEMLDAARRRLADRSNLEFLQRGLEDLIGDFAGIGRFHFVMSSFAIHHLGGEARRALFTTILRHLEPGGSFLNIEAALPDDAAFTEWYYGLWREWIARRSQMLGLGSRFQNVPRQARENPDNQYSPLGRQLADLTAAGFVDVGCHYRNGLFAIYSGRAS